MKQKIKMTKTTSIRIKNQIVELKEGTNKELEEDIAKKLIKGKRATAVNEKEKTEVKDNDSDKQGEVLPEQGVEEKKKLDSKKR